MLTETDLTLPDGRTLRVHDTGGPGRPVVWHHGTPNTGQPPVPAYAAAQRLGLRWIGFDRAGYGGSTRLPGRSVGDVAADVAALAEALDLDRFAVVGHSGGGAHALACAALLPDRVDAAVSMSGLAPRDAAGLDWLAGFASAGAASLAAAERGWEARRAFEDAGEELDFGFTPGDEEALGGRWAWVLDVVRPALAGGPDAMCDDDVAAVRPWGFGPADVTVPVLLVHGDQDRVVPPGHGLWLADHLPDARLRLVEGGGHVTVLDELDGALEWLAG